MQSEESLSYLVNSNIHFLEGLIFIFNSFYYNTCQDLILITTVYLNIKIDNH